VLQPAAASDRVAAAPPPGPVTAEPEAASAPDWAENAARFSGPGGSELYLDVVVNGMARGLHPFGWRDGELWVTAATLRRLGLAPAANAGDVVRLAALPEVQSVYDAAQQRLTIDAALAALRLPTTVLDAPGITNRQSNGSNGALLNYDVYALQASRGTANLNAWSELRAFGAAGVVSSTAWTQLTRRDGGEWAGESTRLDTSWSRSFPDPMLTLRVGDTLTGALPWTRATRIAGVQLATNFALQPYRVTVPTPAFIGSASLPSDVELYVNGLRQYSGKVPAGPFQLNAMPNVNGAGAGQVIVTDMLGRTTTLNFALYATQQLLKEGLSDWTADVGVVRTNYGLRSSRLRARAGHERNVAPRCQQQLHVRSPWRSDARPGQCGSRWRAADGTAGVVSASAAQSRDDGRSGSQLGLGYSWRDNRFNFAFSDTPHARCLLGRGGTLRQRAGARQGQYDAGYDSRQFGTFGVSYVYLNSPEQPASRFAGASWSRAVGRTASASVSVLQDLVDRGARSVYCSVFDHARRQCRAQRRRAARPGDGVHARCQPVEGQRRRDRWRTGLRRGGDQDGGLAEVDYAGRYGRAAAGISVLGANRHAYQSASGALVLMAGNAFATRRIDDAFAVVSTDGIADVPVTVENPPDRHDRRTRHAAGDAAAGLREQPARHRCTEAARRHAHRACRRRREPPSDRAGVLVRIGITPIRAASIVLVDAAGQPLPLGSLVRLPGQDGDDAALVGFDGAVYLDGWRPAMCSTCRRRTAHARLVRVPQAGGRHRTDRAADMPRGEAMNLQHEVRLAVWLVVAWFLLLGADAARAAPVTCTGSFTNLAFGSVTPAASQTDATATLNYTCTNSGGSVRYVAACFASASAERPGERQPAPDAGRRGPVPAVPDLPGFGANDALGFIVRDHRYAALCAGDRTGQRQRIRFGHRVWPRAVGSDDGDSRRLLGSAGHECDQCRRRRWVVPAELQRRRHLRQQPRVAHRHGDGPRTSARSAPTRCRSARRAC
jgi:outer membrane usher protein